MAYCYRKQSSFVLEQIVVTRFGISDQFSYPVQEFTLKNDTPKNGTSCIGLYGSVPPGHLYRFPFTANDFFWSPKHGKVCVKDRLASAKSF